MLKRLKKAGLVPALVVTAVLAAAMIVPDSATLLGVVTPGCGYGYTPIAPTVTNVNPNNGPPAGGTTVTVTGTDFCNVLSVDFGANAGTSINVISSTQLTVVSPAGTAGTVVDITVTTSFGTSATSAADHFSYALFTYYFNWFDTATTGMVGDNIHVLVPGATAAHVTVTLGTLTQSFNVLAGHESHVTFSGHHIGGPVVVTSNQPIKTSQRVQYFQSFNEVWALTAAQASNVSYIQSFDTATPGMVGDNIHLLNPGSVAATVTVTLGSLSKVVVVNPGQEAHTTFTGSHIGGPVKISSTQPILASQRVQYFQSFNEVVAHSAGDASQLSYFNWFDSSTPGMVGDNIHLLNPSASVTAHVTVSFFSLSIPVTIGPGVETHVTFSGHHIGGPVVVSSDSPVLAEQRVQYFHSFNEVGSEDPNAQAGTTLYLMWFDTATPGMVGDNIHVLNSSSSTATVSVSLPGATTIHFTLAPGAETHVSFGAGHIGGPITITSDQPVLGAQRVQYFQSFNEVPAT